MPAVYAALAPVPMPSIEEGTRITGQECLFSRTQKPAVWTIRPHPHLLKSPLKKFGLDRLAFVANTDCVGTTQANSGVFKANGVPLPTAKKKGELGRKNGKKVFVASNIFFRFSTDIKNSWHYCFNPTWSITAMGHLTGRALQAPSSRSMTKETGWCAKASDSFLVSRLVSHE